MRSLETFFFFFSLALLLSLFVPLRLTTPPHPLSLPYRQGQLVFLTNLHPPPRSPFGAPLAPPQNTVISLNFLPPPPPIALPFPTPLPNRTQSILSFTTLPTPPLWSRAKNKKQQKTQQRHYSLPQVVKPRRPHSYTPPPSQRDTPSQTHTNPTPKGDTDNLTVFIQNTPFFVLAEGLLPRGRTLWPCRPRHAQSPRGKYAPSFFSFFSLFFRAFFFEPVLSPPTPGVFSFLPGGCVQGGYRNKSTARPGRFFYTHTPF